MFVAGAGSGLARPVPSRWAGAGASVVLNDIDTVGIEASALLIKRDGGIATVVTGDVCVAADVVRVMQSAVGVYGGIDIMHANADIGRYELLEQMAEPEMDCLLTVDSKGLPRGAKHAVPHLPARGGGSLIFTSSVQATHPALGCVVHAEPKPA